MSEWHVVWVPDPGRWGTLPEAGGLGVEDLPAAVERIGLMPGDPVFIAPDFTIDSDLLEFVLSKHFRFLARETKRNYATDIRILLTFLSSRGIDWRRASEQDLLNYRTWRCDAPQNPERISGSKWNREAAAFTRLFKWARVSPRPVDASRREDRAADSVSARVSWLTPRTWSLWSDVGLRGHGRDGVPTWGWDARTEARNTSFVQFTLSSGLRRQEGGSLLTFELPAQRLQHGRFQHGQLAGAVTRSKNGRTFYTSLDALGQVETYVQSERAWAVKRAQQMGRYERVAQMRLVTKVTRGRAPRVFWVDRDGVEGHQYLTHLGWRERQLLFIEGPEGPEPAWLWLTEQGLPMLPDRWNTVFTTANLRCEEALLTPAEREVGRNLRAAEVRGRTPYATPHSTRHSFALYMLIVLNQLMEARFGLTAADRRDFAMLFGDPWWLVKTLLGHADVETTKRHYLAPVAHLQLESILATAEADGPDREVENIDGVFARLAKESAGIQDIDVIVDRLPVAGR
ncbi:integrase [Streptomyces agglomeratus]|uniref:Integrase n=1 Tax=Streptomyces agglomeratus TaxID=285458 RepID=A0A1E5PH79_9ACTN|nr:site-specific integrase [Streptomyces agglomeratus]OEJ28866.1 integrase [Streptomyces agglomeratus]OEJ37049.1 integrase [Streptomyces agglomeratus]OEJ48403.1 integrase [Streptomyces agglomeratus]